MLLRLITIIVLDLLLALSALYTAALMGSSVLTNRLCDGTALKIFAVFTVISIFSSYLMEVYSPEWMSNKKEIFINCVQGGGASFFFLSVVNYFCPSVIPGHGVVFLFIALFVVLQFSTHVLLSFLGYTNPFTQRVLILGTGELARQMGEMIAARPTSFRLAGYLECSSETADHASAIDRSLLVNNEEDLLGTARKIRANLIVVALPERRGVLPLREMMQCKLNGIEVLDAPGFYEIVEGKLMLEAITPGWIVFSTGFHRTALVNLYKRFIDLILSVTGLILSAPLFPLVALAIKLDSPGPVFFKQVRVGSGEKEFVLYKFRSMTQDAEKNSGAVWATRNDSRVTRVGRILRSSRIDEIPQLLNVLKGEMSFIGPRPERPELVEQLKKQIYYYSKRHTIKPGLTGLAQVRYSYGATVEDAAEKLRYDLFYIKNISLFIDGLILFETVKVVLFGRGAR